jgi:hypothetical protein
VVTDDTAAGDGQGDAAGGGAGDNARVDEAAGTAATVETVVPDRAGTPMNLRLPTNLGCECGGLGLYLVVGVFVNLTYAGSVWIWACAGFICYCSRHPLSWLD